MRAIWLAVAWVAVAGGCTGKDNNPCGLAAGTPDVPSGTLQATRDGNSYVANSGLIGYQLQTDRTNIEAGDLTLMVGKDKDGNNVKALVDSGKFPICVLLSDQSNGTAYAQVRAPGKSYGTDSSHTGTVAILEKNGNELVGRFELTGVENGGSSTTKLENGAFRLSPR